MVEHVFSSEMMQEREKQLILALADCAGAYYDINFTQNKILGTPIQCVNGVVSSIAEYIGMPEHCSYTDIVRYWGSRLAQDDQAAFFDFFDIDRIQARYAVGERLISHRYWTESAQGEPLLTIQKIRLYQDLSTGDLLGLTYVSNDRDLENALGIESELKDLYREATQRVSTLQEASLNLPGGYHRCGISEGYPFLFVSKSFEQLVGYTREQLEQEVDNKFINLVLPEDLERFAQLERDLAGQGRGDVAYRIRRRDGQIRWVQDSTMHIVRDGVPCFQCTIADITDFVAQQERFAKEKAEFDQIAQNIPCGYHRCSTNGGFLLEFVSDSFLETVGYTREELLGTPFLNLVAPEDLSLFMSHEPQLARSGRVDLAYRIVRKDGQKRWIKDSTRKVEYNGNAVFQCTLADITDFVQQQEEMQHKNLELMQKKILRDAMESNMPSGYHRCKAEAGCPFLYIGKHFTDIVGYTQQEIETEFGNLYSNLIWPEDREAMLTFDRMSAMIGQGNQYGTSVYRMKHKDGGYRWVTDSTMFVDMGQDSFFQATISDITEYIDSVNEARERAEASSQAKSAFLFNASHDIRTPMNAIQGFADIIEQNAGDATLVLDTVQKLKRAGDVLLTLLNDVLELSRIEQGKDVLTIRPLDMPAHTEKLKEMMNLEMNQSGIHFQLTNDIEHPLVLADDLKLTRIAMNLLSNAKKFTAPGGTVSFGVREHDFDGKKAIYSLFVRDTGIGMSEEFQARAFEQFEREKTATNSGVSGSGLGLAITKKLVDLVGGTCTIESELGKGTCITCSVPLAITQPEAFQPENVSMDLDCAGKRILLVEDNDFNREIARYVFEGMGFKVDEAVNGVACIDMLSSAPVGTYDLILMDIQMPVMDGYMATKEIRRHPDPAVRKLPIIAMTANAFDEDRKKCIAVGMNGHVSKPMDANAIRKEMARVLFK